MAVDELEDLFLLRRILLLVLQVHHFHDANLILGVIPQFVFVIVVEFVTGQVMLFVNV